MQHKQIIGGIAAIAEGLIFLFAMIYVVVVMLPAGFKPDGSTEAQLAYYSQHRGSVFLVDVLVHITSSIAQAILVLALFERFKQHSGLLVRTATTFGLIWAGWVMLKPSPRLTAHAFKGVSHS